MIKVITLSLFFIISAGTARAEWIEQHSGTNARFRGVSAVNSSVAWASGERGTFARTTDGGKLWQTGVVPGAADLDFRDVEAFDADTAYLLSIGEGEKSRIYKTTDGGRSWSLQFKSSRPQAFFDAMAFWDRDHGLAISDPVEGRFLIIYTSDGGRSWKELPKEGMPQALSGESAFAASGTCITVQGTENIWFGTGGPGGARVFSSKDRGRTWSVSTTPLVSGKSAGIFSVSFWNAKRGVIVGGDYTKESESKQNAAITRDGGKTWTLITGSVPAGYRSCVLFVPGTSSPTLITVGPNGSEYSQDGGNSWTSIATVGTTLGYHSASFAGPGAGWAVGETGRVAKYRGVFILKAKAAGKKLT